MPVTFRRMYGWTGSEWIPITVDADTGSVSVIKNKNGDTRTEYSSGDILYFGTHVDHKAAEADTGWVINKYTTGADGITRIEKLTGSWTGRAALDWS